MPIREPMCAAVGAPPSASPSRLRSVEAFSRDLLQLVRCARMYPDGHPALEAAAARAASIVSSHGGLLDLGVARGELLLGETFIGEKGTRAGELAGLLHERKVARLRLTGAATSADLAVLGGLLAGQGTGGGELRKALREAGVYAVDVEPLDLEKIHAAAQLGSAGAPEDETERRRRAWLWLQHRDATTEQLAGLLATDDFWAPAAAALHDPAEGPAFAAFLSGLGHRLEEALRLLPEVELRKVIERLAKAGSRLSSADLLRLVDDEVPASDLRGLGLSSLLRDLDGERFVDLLAGLATVGGRGTQRLAAVFRRFAPKGGSGDVLSLVRARLSPGCDHGFAAEVWRTVEEFVLRLEEDPFMAQDYSDSLEGLFDAAEATGAEQTEEGLREDPDRHLDWVLLGVAADGGDSWRDRMLERVEQRARALGAWKGIALANLADELLPGVLDSRPALARELFRAALGATRDASAAELGLFTTFCVLHERILLDTALRALAEEQRIASRRFLVDVLSAFSSASTPAMVSRARAGPWFVARNLAIVLGRQGGGKGVPALLGLADHEHVKVRREALRGLATVGSQAARAGLQKIEADRGRPEEERLMAARFLLRTAGGRTP